LPLNIAYTTYSAFIRAVSNPYIVSITPRPTILIDSSNATIADIAFIMAFIH